ncbi:9290_t:CDS:1 [Scutellospora calospora]|uniref:9290_t:CDS:1 n=1 Tax=Scutellospora calospora TaxID=85575 RepID=A0ACA9M3X1_9GLOM|nr:9290_t:CDS:1 [Scutellospora calospora]
MTKILNNKISSIIEKTNNKKDLNDLKKIITEHRLLSNKQKEIIKNNINKKIVEIKKNSKPEKPDSNKEILVKEIEKNIIEINKDNVEKLLDNEDIDKKIQNSKLSPSNIKKLQESRKNILLNFRIEIYDQYINIIKTEKNKILLNDLNNDILKNKILTHEQIQDISRKNN